MLSCVSAPVGLSAIESRTEKVSGSSPSREALRLAGRDDHGQERRSCRDECMPPSNVSDIRAWVQQQGMTVSDRGGLSQDVMAAYDKAHQKPRAAKAVKPGRAASAPGATATARPATKPRRSPGELEPERPASVPAPSAAAAASAPAGAEAGGSRP